jgi:hypothetical protein
MYNTLVYSQKLCNYLLYLNQEHVSHSKMKPRTPQQSGFIPFLPSP